MTDSPASKLQISLAIVLATVAGFLIGQVRFSPQINITEQDIKPDIALIELKEIFDDKIDRKSVV